MATSRPRPEFRLAQAGPGWLRPLQRFSPFYQYIGHDPLRAGISWSGVGIATGTFLVLVAVAVWGSCRRDARG